MSPIPSIIGGAEAPSNTTVNQPQTTTTDKAPDTATNQSTAPVQPPVQPPAQLPKEKTLADVLKTFLADIGFDKQENKIDEVAWFLSNTESKQPVGRKKPNT